MGQRRRNETTAPVDALVSRAVQRAEREDESAVKAGGPQVGDLVVADREVGVGSLSWLSGDVARISYFASVGEPDAERQEAPLAEVRPAGLDPNRRCWVRSEESWWPGRVLSSRGREVVVELPGVTATLPMSSIPSPVEPTIRRTSRGGPERRVDGPADPQRSPQLCAGTGRAVDRLARLDWGHGGRRHDSRAPIRDRSTCA